MVVELFICLAGSSNLIQFDSISQTIAQFKGAECSLYHSNTKRFKQLVQVLK